MKRAVALSAAAVLGCSGPPAVTLEEQYPDTGSAVVRVDDSALARVLAAHVRDDDTVDYRGLLAEPADLDAYVGGLADVRFDSLSRDQRLALLINAYNACTLRLILDHWPLASIRDIPAGERWAAERWNIGGTTLSLEQIEHDYLRARFREPRIHFAVNCASAGCPPLRAEPYDAERIDEQLEAQARRMHGDPRWFELDAGRGVLRLTMLYSWYAGDFAQVAGSAPAYAARFSPPLREMLERGDEPDIEWIDYDWSLNSAGR